METSNIKLNEQVQMILDVANQLRGPFKEDEYQNVIIPMTILRRFECILEKTKNEVLEEVGNGKPNEKVLRSITNLCIYNTSQFNLTNLQEDPGKLSKNLKDYIDHFNDVAKSIFVQLKFYETIDDLAKAKKLFVIVKKFANTDLSVEHVNSMQMGYIMEEIIRTYSENASAGDHFTPREVIRCLTQLLLAEGCDDLYDEGKIVTLGDFACGTGGMLSEGYKMLKELNDSNEIHLYGQDNNGKYEAMCLAEMIIKGQNPDNVKLVSSTLTTDAFPNQKMRLILMNPPFGLSYSKEKIGDEEHKIILGHNKKDDWYEAGLPQTKDSQTLFWQFALNKLEDNGRAAIICNASPLFNGSESDIRKWILEKDYIEAIIQFCPELFYNTGITIYAIIFNKNKRAERKGKVQLIDASKICTRMAKGLGFKRNRIDEDPKNNQIARIVKLYSDFAPCKECKILTKEDFYYKEVTINQPFQRNFKISKERIENLYGCAAMNKLFDEDVYEEMINSPSKTKEQLNFLKEMELNREFKKNIFEMLNKHCGEKIFKNKEEFSQYITSLIPDLGKAEYKSLLKGIVLSLSDFDDTADLYKNKKGFYEADSELKDIELIPFNDDIKKYFDKEIKPYIPKAWMEYDPENLNISCEINFNRFFYQYKKPESTAQILKELEEIKSKETKLENIFYGRK